MTRHPYSPDKSVLSDTAKRSQRSVKLRKDVHPGIHTATASVLSDTAKNAAFSDAAAISVAQKTVAPRHSHSNDKFVFSDKAIVRKDGHPGNHTAISSCLVVSV